jgi:hypothetical protein
MINWEFFKKLIGNGSRKYVSRGGVNYIFISYNSDDDHITIMKVKDHEQGKKRLYDITLESFKEDFTFTKQTEEKPIF